MNSYIQLDYLDLILAGSLLFINGGLSVFLKLRLTRQIAIASLRMVVQLMAVGFVLKALFLTVSPWLTGLVAMAMVLFAGREIVARQDRRFNGWWTYGLGVSCMAMAAIAVSIFALTTQLQADPWYHPQFAIPLLGMILGNTMTGVALALDTMTTHARQQRTAIEARLALGSTRNEALRAVKQQAMRVALMPTINAMAATGLVALPGMMTGQILSGVDPIEAAKYQLLVMFLIAGGTSLGAVAAVLLGAMRLSDERHRLRLDRLIETS
jgi:putative ABC transport system permease protein